MWGKGDDNRVIRHIVLIISFKMPKQNTQNRREKRNRRRKGVSKGGGGEVYIISTRPLWQRPSVCYKNIGKNNIA